MINLGKIKRGDTFAFIAGITDSSGNVLVTDIENIRCQIRDSNFVLCTSMTVTESETPGKYLFQASDTTTFPIGALQLDIQINIDGVRKTSDTMQIIVDKEVTRIE